LINSGVYAIGPELVASLPAGTFADFGTDVLPSAVAQGLPVFTYRIDAPAIDIGTPDGLALADAAMREVV
jgi:NDP-sugar pyrophosphorylase family protein